MFQVVGTAVDGSEALHMAELLEPDLILMDWRMPVVDGLQATEILRRRVPDIRIIIMTLDASATAEAEARAHGAHGFIWKPRIMNDLMTEVRRAFRSNHTKEEAEQLPIPSRSGASTGVGTEPCSRTHLLQSAGHRTERSLLALN
jgi:CheY-like chemotaxis protein